MGASNNLKNPFHFLEKTSLSQADLAPERKGRIFLGLVWRFSKRQEIAKPIKPKMKKGFV